MIVKAKNQYLLVIFHKNKLSHLKNNNKLGTEETKDVEQKKLIELMIMKMSLLNILTKVKLHVGPNQEEVDLLAC
jgi:hypothetical protein